MIAATSITECAFVFAPALGPRMFEMHFLRRPARPVRAAKLLQLFRARPRRINLTLSQRSIFPVLDFRGHRCRIAKSPRLPAFMRPVGYPHEPACVKHGVEALRRKVRLEQ